MELSLRERDRMAVRRLVSEGVLTPTAGAERLGVTRRHMRRPRRRFATEAGLWTRKRKRARHRSRRPRRAALGELVQ